MFLNVHTHFPVNPAFEILNAETTAAGNQYFSAGIHPQQSAQFLLKISALEVFAQNPHCLAIGESGLDKIIAVPLPDQVSAFEMQIQLSEKYGLPLILHCVKAWNEVLQVHKKLNPKQKWIFHGFRKTTLLESVLEAGLMISIGTAVLYDEKLQQIILSIPDERLLLETDSDQAHSIEEVYGKVAELKEIPVGELEEIVEGNFRRVFLKFGM